MCDFYDFYLIAQEYHPSLDEMIHLLKQKEVRRPISNESILSKGEVWYSIARTTSPETADQYVNETQGMTIDIVDADWQLTRQAAVIKANGKLVYGDCFATALAKNRKAELITGNKEFEVLEGEIEIAWV